MDDARGTCRIAQETEKEEKVNLTIQVFSPRSHELDLLPLAINTFFCLYFEFFTQPTRTHN